MFETYLLFEEHIKPIINTLNEYDKILRDMTRRLNELEKQVNPPIRTDDTGREL